jgi:hypothetical protein
MYSFVHFANQQVHKAHGITDPLLTDLGRTQATSLAIALQREISRGMPMPEKWFVSPLKRCGETCGLEWGWAFQTTTGGASKDMGHGVKATVVEVSHSAAQLSLPGFQRRQLVPLHAAFSPGSRSTTGSLVDFSNG